MGLTREEFMKALTSGAEGNNPYAEAAGQLRLQKYLKGGVGPDGTYAPGAEALQQKQELSDQAQQALDLQQKLGAMSPGRKYNVRSGTTDISEAQQMPPLMAQLAQSKQKENKQENLSKRYENITGFNSALQDIDKLSDTGKGGVLSNPDAQIPGTGKLQSALPDSVMGVAEYLNATPKGSTEMRKSLSRLQLEYARAMGGARGVNPMMIQKEKEAMGYMASGDPELVKKGILSLAENVKNRYKTIQSGYTPDVVSAVHDSLGGDPTAPLQNLPSTGPAGRSVSGPLQETQPQAKSPSQGTLRVRHKASGQTGTIPTNEFDPNVYEQVQ